MTVPPRAGIARKSDGSLRQAGPRRLDFDLLPGLLGYTLRRAQVRVFQDFAAAMRGLDVTPGQFGALVLIAANRGLSQTELGRALGIDRSSVVPLVDRLQRHGLVRRGPCARDRRAHALELSEAGRALLDRLGVRVQAHERRILARLLPAERRALMALLARVAAG
ncbi:MAG: MarR family winged helix-turn-helix transcriptional regulator [Pseudomonadota bacterium]